MDLLSALGRWLGDFSGGEREGRRLERMLRVALAETTSEPEFHALLRRMIRREDELRSEERWVCLYQLLEEHKGTRDDWRTAAEHLVAFLPRQHGYRSEWDDHPGSDGLGDRPDQRP